MSWIVSGATSSKVSRAHPDVSTQWGWEAREPRIPTPHSQVGAPDSTSHGSRPQERPLPIGPPVSIVPSLQGPHGSLGFQASEGQENVPP